MSRTQSTDPGSLQAGQPRSLGQAPSEFRRLMTCSDCKARASNICSYLAAPRGATGRANSPAWQLHERARPRRNLKSAGEHTNRVAVLCDGWAFRFVQLPDGRRQILSILLPGDVVTPTRIYSDRIEFSVQAITNTQYCGYDRIALNATLQTDKRLAAEWTKLILDEQQRTVALLINLGRRSADERVAHLIFEIYRRLDLRGLVVDRAFPFPLSQRTIADATGLTPEHVNRIVGAFRRAGWLEVSTGRLKVTNPEGLRRIGDINF